MADETQPPHEGWSCAVSEEERNSSPAAALLSAEGSTSVQPEPAPKPRLLYRTKKVKCFVQFRVETQLSLPQPGELHIGEGGSHDKVDKLSVGEGDVDHLGGKVNNTQKVNGGERWTGRRHWKVDINIFIDVLSVDS